MEQKLFLAYNLLHFFFTICEEILTKMFSPKIHSTEVDVAHWCEKEHAGDHGPTSDTDSYYC